jgi:hypothetical protein
MNCLALFRAIPGRGCVPGRRERAQSGRRQAQTRRRFALVDASLSEYGAIEGGTSCRGPNRLGDGRHPRYAPSLARFASERWWLRGDGFEPPSGHLMNGR